MLIGEEAGVQEKEQEHGKTTDTRIKNCGILRYKRRLPGGDQNCENSFGVVSGWEARKRSCQSDNFNLHHNLSQS